MWMVIWLTVALGAEVPRSEALLLSGDVTSALAAAESEAKSAPGDVATQERLVDILLGLGAIDKATKRFSERVRLDPENPDAHYLLGRALPGIREARQAYERALKLSPLHARSHMGMGAIHTALGDLPSAGAAYGRAVRIDPALGEAWLGLVRTHLAQEDLATAIQVARLAIQAVPESADAYLTLAALVPAERRAVLTEGAAKAGHDPRVHAALADVLLEAGEARQAVRSANAALAIDPTEPTALRVDLFGRQILEKTLDMEGYRALKQARGPELDALITKYPKTPVSWLARANQRAASGDTNGALADLRRAQSVGYEEVEVMGHLGVALAERGQHAEAADLLVKASRARPWDESLARAAGTALSKAGRHDEAVPWLRDLSAKLPYVTPVSIALADALLLAGDVEAAYQVTLAAAERKTDPQVLVALMTLAAQSGRYDEAAEMLEEIGRSTNDPRAIDLAAKLRAKAEQAR